MQSYADSEPLVYDIPAVGRVLGDSDNRRVRRLIADGHLPARLLPGRARPVILREDLLEFLRNLPRVEAGAG